MAFDAVDRGIAAGADVVVIDTAGRLHTKTGLMDELGKVKRVVGKRAEVDEVLLVLDATIGQNGLAQAKVFADVVDITGVVLTKAGRHRQGRHRVPRSAGAQGARQAGRSWARTRRPGPVRAGRLRRRATRLTRKSVRGGPNCGM